MTVTDRWRKEVGARLQGSRALDSSKLQAPGVVPIPEGGFRLFYTAVGPAKPFPTCQGYILSAVSDDGVIFHTEPGIRVVPQPRLPHMSLRVIAPSVTRLDDGSWRMYFESRGPADQPPVICSAISSDMLYWEIEAGSRLQNGSGIGGPRYLELPEGGGRLYCFSAEFGPGGPTGGERISQGVISARASDGLDFEFEPGYRMLDKQARDDGHGITAAEVIPPQTPGDEWSMIFSIWQDAPPGTAVPKHPSQDPNAEETGLSEDFAAASIATDIAGFRSRICVAYSVDGLVWDRARCIIEGAGYGQEGMDAIHAEDMSLVAIGRGQYRMYYAACDNDGVWRILSAVTAAESIG